MQEGVLKAARSMINWPEVARLRDYSDAMASYNTLNPPFPEVIELAVKELRSSWAKLAAEFANG